MHSGCSALGLELKNNDFELINLHCTCSLCAASGDHQAFMAEGIGGFVFIFFSKHRPSGPMLCISQFVHMCVSVCVCVCLSVCSLLRYRLTVFLPPLPEVGCPKILEILNPWGKVMERRGLRFEHFF